MKTNRMLISVIATLLLCFGAFVGVLATGKAPILGLDLRGGDDFVYCPTSTHSGKCAPAGSVSNTKLNEVVQILQDRVGGLGVVQPNISVQGGDIDVQVPGDVNRATLINIIGHTSNLYFRKVLCFIDPYEVPVKSKTTTTTSTTSTTSPATTTTVNKKGSTSTTDPTTTTTTKPTTTTSSPSKTTTTTKPPTTTTTSTTTTPPQHYNAGYTLAPACPSTFTSTTGAWPYTGNYQGGTSASDGVNTQAQDLANPTQNMILPYTGTSTSGSGFLRLEVGPVQADATVLSGASAQVGTSGNVVGFTFNGAAGLDSWNKNVAGPDYYAGPQEQGAGQGVIADDLSGQIVAYATNQAQTYTSSGGQISGLDPTQIRQITLLLQYGALPVNIQPLTETTVSPSLGQASLQAGVAAGLVGLVLVMGYTIWYYRALGIVVVLGLTSTAALIYAIISAAKLTLDLSGVTGLIVAIGITVDSYIVYFERLKDEVRAGRSIRSSVDKGFKSAFRTIVSADLVSLIGALVLYFLSIGAVKNFAFMLGISTILDLGSAYFFTRPLVILLGRNRVFTEARGLGIARGLAAATAGEA